MTEYQPGEQHPEEYREDLNPDALAGENVGFEDHEEGAAGSVRMADGIKGLYDRLPGFTADELARIPVLKVGTRLQQGATYIDLRSGDPQEFTATGDMIAGRQNWYVNKSEIGFDLWNRLVGVKNPARLRG